MKLLKMSLDKHFKLSAISVYQDVVFLSQQKYQVPDADPPIFTCPYQTQVFKTKITRILPKYGNRYFRAHIGTTYKVAQKPGRQG